MKKFLCVIFSVLFCITTSTVLAKQEAPNQEFINKYYFDIDLKGMKDIYFFRESPFYTDKGQVSPLGKAVLSVLQGDIWTWAREPRIYIKENIAYIHAVKLDDLNLLYTLKRENNVWKVVKIEKKKLPTVGSEAILEQAFLRAIGIKYSMQPKRIMVNQGFLIRQELLILYKMNLMISMIGVAPTKREFRTLSKIFIEKSRFLYV
ncbi:hypothetical protein [Bacillus thuringiensis]|uniref:hypothetical protein n=1 Tax=Bacillus thuringiensis TaxID=1428 RepID=UPI001F41CAF5|nr:hypothetical protein [Bacillus thuringiensis]